jgi:hypothetical protein
MRLYSFKPRGHGEKSFFVVAECEEDARIAIRKRIADLVKQPFGYSQRAADTFDTDYYKVKCVKFGVVITNDND